MMIAEIGLKQFNTIGNDTIFPYPKSVYLCFQTKVSDSLQITVDSAVTAVSARPYEEPETIVCLKNQYVYEI